MARTMGRRTITIISLVLGAALGGCGYQFGGGVGLLPKDVQTIYVEPFINRSREVGIDKELTTAVRGELYRKGRLRLAEQAEQADVILSGVVRSLESITVSVNGFDEVLQLQAQMIVDLNLRRREPNEILWRGPGITLTQIYAGSRGAVVIILVRIPNRDAQHRGRAPHDGYPTHGSAANQVAGAVDGPFCTGAFQRLMEMF